MKTSEFCFKSFGTCVVLVIALSIVGWISGSREIFGLVALVAIIGGIALVVGIISSIWEK